jgi:hypothetical protein
MTSMATMCGGKSSGVRVASVSSVASRRGRDQSARRRGVGCVTRIGRRELIDGVTTTTMFGVLFAATEGPSEAKTYKRSFRERFETSISSATHDYSFTLPDDWEADIVSLNDGKLYGVDTRYKSGDGNGQLAVSVLPFVGSDTIKDAGTPEQVLERFDELVGAYWEKNGFGIPGNAGTPKDTSVVTKNGVIYYKYELERPHNLISASVVDGQLYLMVASCGARSWKTEESTLRAIVDSFSVPP